MNKKDLEKLGLTAEALEKAELKPDVLDQIIVLHGKDIEGHKTKLATAESERDELKTQLVDANTAIDGFKALKPEELQQSIEDYKAKLKQAEIDAQAKINDLKFDHALDGALSAAKVKDIVSVKAHLKTADLKLNESGKILGLDEQLEALKTDKEFLFESETPEQKIITGGKSGSVISDAVVEAAMRGANLLTDNKK